MTKTKEHFTKTSHIHKSPGWWHNLKLCNNILFLNRVKSSICSYNKY